MRIYFAGLTAVGKTTHARILARSLGVPVIEATPLLLAAAGRSGEHGDHPWFTGLDAMEQLRDEDSSIDASIDRQLVTLSQTLDDAVFDTWALPWLTTAPGMRILLQSNPQARAWKAYVSQGLRRRLTVDECGQLIAKKDAASRDRFLNRHGFDITDDAVFDVVIDSSALMTGPTFASARHGISALKPLIELCVLAWKAPTRASLRALDESLGQRSDCPLTLRGPLDAGRQ